ncbi:capsule biosynthesis protein [Sphingobium sufflavum]|uniref:capsule biosynthesis protein n=1 Tax=Sphingobium sufflavum TaxID=1129547 RepID=UPI001F2EB836|nr:capsule biosynthesis protein [Sphingobium sufflavum]MCE7798397.1 capsule biosynthesis protein [Sphingobium sufflavum]
MNVMPEFSQEETAPASSHLLPKKGGGLGRWAAKHKWFILFVVFPVSLVAIYYGFIASDQYVSESSFVIKAPGQRGTQISSLANLIQTTGVSGSQDETSEVIGYIRSRSALHDVMRRENVRAIYMSPVADRLSRFPFPLKEDKFDSLFKYYGKMVDVNAAHDSGLVRLTVKAFTPQEAYVLNRSLLDLSEILVNRLNDRAQRQAIAETEKRVAEAQARLKDVRVRLAQFRNSEDLIDPEKQAGAILEIASKLKVERATLQAQANVMQKETPNHPALPSIRSRITAISGLIGGQTGQVVGGRSAIASKLGGYEALVVEQQFATQLLTIASSAMEQARSEAVKQQFYLQRIVAPNVPDLAEYPSRLKIVLTVLGAALCLYFIGWMLIVGILEHAPED